MTGQPQPGTTVSLSQDGHAVASVTADSRGRFTFTPAPGTYVVDGCGALLPSSETVTVHEGRTTQHDITCSVP